MQLYISNGSPFGHLCLARAWLLELNDLQLTFTDPWQNPPELTAKNPFSQVPALVTDTGEVIYNSLLICQYMSPQTPTAGEFSTISYASTLLDSTINALKLEKKANESRDHFLVHRNLKAIASALSQAPTFQAASREWPQVMLGICLLALKRLYPEIFNTHARTDTQQAIASFEEIDFIQKIKPDTLAAKQPATIGDILK